MNVIEDGEIIIIKENNQNLAIVRVNIEIEKWGLFPQVRVTRVD